MNEANTMADIIGQDDQARATDDGVPAAPETVEQEIRRKGLTAPRVTPSDIEANIERECYFTAAEGVEGQGSGAARVAANSPLRLLTFCVLVLRNGYTVHGVSACASPENFNAELGRRIARENAVREMWPLMGYALRERLSMAPLLRVDFDLAQSRPGAVTYVDAGGVPDDAVPFFPPGSEG